MESNLFTIKEAAIMLRVSPSFVYRKTESGEIESVRISARKVLVRKESIEAYIEKKTSGGVE